MIFNSIMMEIIEQRWLAGAKCAARWALTPIMAEQFGYLILDTCSAEEFSNALAKSRAAKQWV